MLEDLGKPAPRVDIPAEYSPAVSFDANGGEATLPPVEGDKQIGRAHV